MTIGWNSTLGFGIVAVVGLASCTINEQNDNVPIAGAWVSDDYACAAGAPPTEEITIDQSGSNVTTKKTKGDNCVATGNVTWQGVYDKSPFNAKLGVGTSGTPTDYVDATVVVVSSDELAVTITGSKTLKFSRKK